MMPFASLLILGLFGAEPPEKPAVSPFVGLERLRGNSSVRYELPGPTPADREQVVKADYPVEVGKNGSVVLLLPKGPRTITEIEILPTKATIGAWREARLRLLWETDDPDAAGLDMPVGFAFDGLGPKRAIGEKTFAGATEEGWMNRLPMPFRTEAMIRIDSSQPISGRIRVKLTPFVELDAGYLRGKLFDEIDRKKVREGRLIAHAFDDGSFSEITLDALDIDQNREFDRSARTRAAEASAVANRDLPVVPSGETQGSMLFMMDITKGNPDKGVARVKSDASTASRIAFFWYSNEPVEKQKIR